MRWTKIGLDTGFFHFFKNKEKSNDEENHYSAGMENRHHLRIYVDLPVMVELTLPGREPEIFIGRSFDLSEGGIYMNFWVKKELINDIEEQVKDIKVRYKFMSPDELSEEYIHAIVRRNLTRLHKKKSLIELNIGLQNVDVPMKTGQKILEFINTKAMDALQVDIAHFEDIKQERELNESEQKVYDNLLKEKQSRS